MDISAAFKAMSIDPLTGKLALSVVRDLADNQTSRLDLVRLTSLINQRTDPRTDDEGWGKAGKAIQVNANMFQSRFKGRGMII
jgi:hypothetical protein